MEPYRDFIGTSHKVKKEEATSTVVTWPKPDAFLGFMRLLAKDSARLLDGV